jgi:hypothetical protein
MKTPTKSQKKETRQIIYERIIQLLKKFETKNYNSATIPAFRIALDGDLDDLIEQGKLAGADLRVQVGADMFKKGWNEGKAQAEKEIDKLNIAITNLAVKYKDLEKDMSDHLEAVHQRTKQDIIELFKEDSIYTGAVIKYEINNMK